MTFKTVRFFSHVQCDHTQEPGSHAQHLNKAATGLHPQRGVSVLQMVVVLIVGSILTMAGVMALRYIDEAKVNNEAAELSSLRGSTVMLAQQRGGNFTGIDTGTVASLNFFPSARVSGTGASTVVTNQWKGTITVAPATIVSTNDGLLFTYTGVPTAACKSIVTPASQIATAISIGGTAVKTLGGALNLANAITLCDAAADSATIAYTMSK